MFECRYKGKPDSVWRTGILNLNTSALGEVCTGDDSVFFSELEVKVGEGAWKPLVDALKAKILLPNNYNTYLAEPHNDKQRERGYI